MIECLSNMCGALGSVTGRNKLCKKIEKLECTHVCVLVGVADGTAAVECSLAYLSSETGSLYDSVVLHWALRQTKGLPSATH